MTRQTQLNCHLITIEALEEYFRVTRPGGILLIHCSNRYLNIPGLLQANAEAMGIDLLHKETFGLDNGDSSRCDWVVFSISTETLQILRQRGWHPYQNSKPLPRPWTDQFSSIMDMLL